MTFGAVDVFYRLAYFFVSLYARLLCRRVVVGRENIPHQGPFLVVSNHLGSMDPPLVVSLFPARLGLVGMAAMAHRKDFFVGWLLDKAGAVWVRRGEADREALRQALRVMESGRPLGIAPEGTRSRTGALIQGKSGATYLALKAGVPILPVAIAGTEKVFPTWRRFRRPTVHVKIGPLFYLPSRGDARRSQHTAYCDDLIMTRLASMLPEAYRGYYAGHPLIAYWEKLDAEGASERPAWVRAAEPAE